MKKLLLLKSLLLLCALIVGTNAWADTSTLTFTAACGGSGTADDGAEWTVTSDGTESSYDNTKGIHYGTGSAQVTYIKLTTSGITGTITKVVVNASTASGVSATASVTVGGSAFGGAAQSLTSSAANYTFNGSASGEIIVTVTKPSKATKALYVKSVAVTYTTSGSSDPSSNVSFTNTTPSINYPATSSYSQAATTADGYDGAITYSITANTAGATINASTGLVTVTGGGSVTVKASAAETAAFTASEATYTLTVNDTREDTELAFGEASVTKTWGESFTGQELTNPHSLSVTWSSTNETVATVNASGVVTMLKAGTTTIKATFAGDATYKNDIVSYTLTINKAPAGLSYTTTSFNIKLNDASFVAPTLNNPNGLTVTYASDNETVATVDENTGVLAYEETTAGTAKITASFAGNDNYYPGSANYTIYIVDPTVKGCVFNPYTVAEIEGQASATTFGNNIYVTGYIVGSVSNNKCYKETSSLVNTNLLLADTPDISFTEGVNVASNSDGLMPVELPSSPSSIRTNWGIKDNPSKLGYKILIKGNAQSYFGTNSIKGTSEISAISASLTPAKTYTTLTSAYALDFTSVSDDLKAYIATEIAENKVQMVQVNKVPAGTGLVLKATTPGSAVNVPVFDGTGADDVSGNNMVGSATATTAIAENGGYILKDGVFQPATAGTLAAGKAYLAIAVSNARALEMSFDEDVTAISATLNDKGEMTNDSYFNLAGQRVAQPTKGLYIVNGKKVIVK